MMRLACLFVLAAWAGPVAASDEAAVTVVAILASDRHANIDPKLQHLARELRQKDPSLTGFRVERSASQVVPFGKKEVFPLVGELKADVTVVGRVEKGNRFRLTVKLPEVGEITYTTATAKYYPILTRHQTDKDKERLIVAVMVKPAGAAAAAGK